MENNSLFPWQLDMTREEILRNAEALANTVPDETVRGLIQHAYIKGAEDSNTINVETVTDPA